MLWGNLCTWLANSFWRCTPPLPLGFAIQQLVVPQISIICSFTGYLLQFYLLNFRIFYDVMKWWVFVCFLICLTLSVHLIFFSILSSHRACGPPPIFFITYKFQQIKKNESIYDTFENINLDICFLNRTYKILFLYMLVVTLSITWWTWDIGFIFCINYSVIMPRHFYSYIEFMH